MRSVLLKISSIELLGANDIDGLTKTDKKLSLGNVVVLAGKNGAGKTRLIKRLEKYIKNLNDGTDNGELRIWINDENDREVQLSDKNVSNIELVNYSHYDAQLQSAKEFTPYVISKSKDLLQHHDYGVTALNAFLLLEDMAHKYSPEFQDVVLWDQFVKDYLEPFGIKISKDPDTNDPLFFGSLRADSACLSPGQQYLLRMAVACFRNENNNKVVFILDEPELHLHPQAQIALIDKIRSKFPNAQLWISTHSLSLIAYLTGIEDDTTLLYLSDGQLKTPRSDLSQLLDGLVGSDTNLLSIRQLLSSPEEYACTHFAVECMNKPDVSYPLPENPQNVLLKNAFTEGAVIIDYGAGKCRLLEEMELLLGREKVTKINYYAYDAYNTNERRAKAVLSSYGFSSDHYFEKQEDLVTELGGKADYIFLVNVLHEIPPQEWQSTFDTFSKLLKPKTGVLIIVERSELTVGESPYDEGFLMITPNGASALFGEGNYILEKHQKKEYIVAYKICQDYLSFNRNTVINSVDAIKQDAFKIINDLKDMKEKEKTDKARFLSGIKLAFYLHQFANATIISDKMVGTS